MVKFYFFLVIFYMLNYAKCEQIKDICKEEPIDLDQDFIGCCKGKPSFASEPCIESLSNNNTLSQECFVDCMYRDFKIYDGDKILMNGVKTFFESNVNDFDIRDMFLTAFEYCTKIEKNTLIEKFAFAEIQNEHSCDLYPAYMDVCVWYHTLSHCPEKYVDVDDEKCTAKTQWVRQCLLK